ncbi:MAG TPA: SHOCT domain-containing protein [Pseudonocardiaceae bacterium]|nr:SHOCT domain-containing protein [Pseudonocardiaceae bacterium]
MMFWYGTGVNGWGYALMMIGMVLFWGLVIVGIVALVRHLARSGQHTTPESLGRFAPEQVLGERFARGEIDEQEYRQRLDTLRGGDHLAKS